LSIEIYLAINLVVDYILLSVVCKALGLFHPGRILAADALCSAGAALLAAQPASWAALPLRLITLVPASLLICVPAAPAMWPTVWLCLLALSLLCGGLSLLLPPLGLCGGTICLLGGALLTRLALAGHPPLHGGWLVRLRLSVDGRTARFPALIDTGNRLREPFSGLPVLIAEAALLKDILPKRGYRIVRFGALGGEGRMACFKPTAVWIEQGLRRRPVPEIWVAVSPTPLPGACRALAPPEFALYNH